MDNTNHAEVSKFLSYVLRHKPEAIGLTLSSDGWASMAELISGAAKEGRLLTREVIQSVVDNSDKKRFSISPDGLSIRAAQGHSSSQVDMCYEPKVPPAFLYHGTATRFVDSINQQGLLSGSRQYVHLSADPATAISVGQRHGKPVVLKIKARDMHQQGIIFYQADNGVWLTLAVPVPFIDFTSCIH
ncbi:RNA 2'-phosphotransferase [Pectobacterium zantedeschiae]|uniref:Probable RNA 2'-phosphotransferase n=1 Tax=Pectobacterium zantedeschiae TaxID=2034769 RepID=A0A9X8P720_9GAMM|nr:RNA 2'-phosphotransferase [Pectobacterium zantedeschiae]RYC37513.1 RNA 2'-phosphotransferase [Pectobacterium zantedeschiae]RYC46000.1 RNA 2'-phosphotransferase [Pectobacterium zantedeschiae]